MASASDVTKLRSIKNTINFPIRNCGDYTTYLKTYTIINNCGKENTCSLTYPAIPSCTCGSSIACGYNDILGNKPLNYFGIDINDNLGNCQYHTFSNALQNTDEFGTSILRDLPPSMFNTPLKSTPPAIKMKMNSIICCPDKNLKNPKIKRTTKYYISTPKFPTSLCDINNNNE